MSTNSYICRENEDGTYTGVYCHSDGYLTHNGAMLIDHFSDRKKVDELLSLGNLSYLQPRINPDPDTPHSFDYAKRQEGVCLFYGRDRGEKDQQAFPIRLEDVCKSDWIEYCYVFTQDGTWKYFQPVNSNVKLRDLEIDLNAIFQNHKVNRPANEYGWFSNEDFIKLQAEQAEQSNAGAEM